jgi:hypothetical protein
MYFKGSPTLATTCQYLWQYNVPLSIIIKSNTVPCHLVSTHYTDITLEYLVVKIHQQHLQHLREGAGLLLGVSGVNGDILNPGKKKNKAVPLHAMQEHWGRGGIAPTHT